MNGAASLTEYVRAVLFPCKRCSGVPPKAKCRCSWQRPTQDDHTFNPEPPARFALPVCAPLPLPPAWDGAEAAALCGAPRGPSCDRRTADAAPRLPGALWTLLSVIAASVRGLSLPAACEIKPFAGDGFDDCRHHLQCMVSLWVPEQNSTTKPADH